MRVFELLQGPDCSEESAITVVADLIRKVWLEATLFHQKLLVLDLALNTLTAGRIRASVIAKLKEALRTRFALMPLALPTVFQTIDLWQQQRMLNTGLLQ